MRHADAPYLTWNAPDVPIYDYVCSNCSTRTEFIHGIDAPAPRFCPACGAEGTLRKAFVPPVVHFKGSGWAKKDRSSASRTRTKAAAASESGGSSSSDGAAGSRESGESRESGRSGESGESGDSGGSKKAGERASKDSKTSGSATSSEG